VGKKRQYGRKPVRMDIIYKCCKMVTISDLEYVFKKAEEKEGENMVYNFNVFRKLWGIDEILSKQECKKLMKKSKSEIKELYELLAK
jgi:hypothetical protein